MHRHHPHTETQDLKMVFWLNFGFTIIELVGGFFSNSVAIMSDALHDLGDCLAILLAWILAKMSGTKRTEKFSYGHQRFSLIGAFANALILIIGSVFILTETIPRLLNPEPVASWMMIGLAALGVGVNGLAVLKLQGGKSLNSRVISLHLWEDVLGWVAVLIGAVIMHFTGWFWLDSLLALGVTFFILFNAGKALWSSVQIFLQSIPNDISLSAVSHRIKALPGVQGVHDFHIWSLDGEHHVASLHVVVSAETESAACKNLIRDTLSREGIGHATIELEKPDENCPLATC